MGVCVHYVNYVNMIPATIDFEYPSKNQQALLQDAHKPWNPSLGSLPETSNEEREIIPEPVHRHEPIGNGWVEVPHQVPLPQGFAKKFVNIGKFFGEALEALAKEGYESLPSAEELTNEYEKLKRKMPEVPRVVTVEKAMTTVTEGFKSLQDLPESLKETYSFLKDEVAVLLDPNAVVA